MARRRFRAVNRCHLARRFRDGDWSPRVIENLARRFRTGDRCHRVSDALARRFRAGVVASVRRRVGSSDTDSSRRLVATVIRRWGSLGSTESSPRLGARHIRAGESLRRLGQEWLRQIRAGELMSTHQDDELSSWSLPLLVPHFEPLTRGHQSRTGVR